jgi:ABC-type phosphate transport system permease subunit
VPLFGNMILLMGKESMPFFEAQKLRELGYWNKDKKRGRFLLFLCTISISYLSALIIFFYFIKCLLVVYLELELNFILDILGIVSVVLIVKDLIYPHQKLKDCNTR